MIRFVSLLAGAAVLLSAVSAEVPLLDPAKATGDDLVAAFADQAKVNENAYAELSRQMKGRELTFHNFVINGCSTGKDFFDLRLSPMFTGDTMALGCSVVRRFCVSLRFTDEKDIRHAKRVFGSSHPVTIREFSGVVSDTRRSCPASDGLFLEATALVPRRPVEDLPAFDVETVTGADLLQVCRQLKYGMTATCYGDLNELLLDREISFDNAQVIETRERNDGFMDIACCIGEPMSSMAQISPKSVCLIARVPMKSIAALPWGLAGGMRIRRLTGRVAEPSEKSGYRFRRALPLVDVTLDVAWKDEKLPTFDPVTITGDELVELLSKFKDETAFAQKERILERLEGRRLTFSEGWVRTCHRVRLGGKSRVTFGFGSKRGDWQYACELLAVFPSDEVSNRLTSEQRVTNLSGVVALHNSNPSAPSMMNGVMRWHQLTEVSLEAEASAELPPFDEKKITGDELVKMVYAMPNNLSSAQLADLQRRLAGLRLTFHKAYCCSASGGGEGPRWTKASFVFGHELDNGQYCEFRVGTELREPMAESPGRGRGCDLTVTGTVADPDELRPEEAGNLFLKEAEIK